MLSYMHIIYDGLISPLYIFLLKTFLHLSIYLFVFLFYACGGQRKPHRSLFSPYIVWDLGISLRSSGCPLSHFVGGHFSIF